MRHFYLLIGTFLMLSLGLNAQSYSAEEMLEIQANQQTMSGLKISNPLQSIFDQTNFGTEGTMANWIPIAGATETFSPAVGDFFFDPGGPGGGPDGSPGNYPNCNCDTQTTLAGVSQIKIIDMDIFANFDYLRIYDGTDANGTLLYGNGSGDPDNGDYGLPAGTILDATSGNFFFFFHASSVVNRLGWEIEIMEVDGGGGNNDLTCFEPNHQLEQSFSGTYIIWEDNIFSDGTSVTGWNFDPWSNGGNLSFYFSAGSNAVSATAGGTDWLVLGPGDTIGSSSTYGATIGFPTNWNTGADGYLGIKFPCSAPGGECYGYVHMITTGPTGYPATIVDYCFDPDGNDVTIPEEGGGTGDDCEIHFEYSNDDGTGDTSGLLFADDFQVASGTSMEVETIRVRMFNNIGVASTLAIHENNGGVPSATAVETFSNLTPDSQTVIDNNYGMDIYDIEFTLPSTIELDEGVYWLLIQTTYGTDNATNFWTITNSGYGQPGKYSTDGGATWTTNSSNYNFSFTLEGTCEGDGGGNEDGCEWTVHVWEDYYGDEVEWELRDSSNNVLLSGGGYGIDYDDTQTVTAEGPLTFWITNDGFYGDNEPYYEVSNGTDVLISDRMPMGGDTRTYEDLECDEDGGGSGGECSISTLYATGNNGSPGGAVYFDVTIEGDDVILTGIDLNTDNAGAGITVDVYTIAGSYVGNEGNQGAWTLSATGTGVSAGIDSPSFADLDNDITLSANTSYGIALVFTSNNSHYYTNGNGSNQHYENDNLSIDLGAASNVPFDGNPFSPRIFNGGLHYTSAGCDGGGTDPSDDCPIQYEGDFEDGLGNLATGIILAADFPVPAGETWNLDTATFELLYSVTSIDVSFYEDAGGQPGAQIHAPTTLTPTSQNPIGQTSNGTDIYATEVDLSGLGVSLPGGATYWVAIETVAPGGLSYWHFADNTANNGTYVFYSTDYNSWTDASTAGFSVDTAFTICIGDGDDPEPGDCVQDFYVTEDPISGAGYSGGNWVANDIIVEGDTQFKVQELKFETVVINGEPTEFDLEIFEDNGSIGVGASTGITLHIDSSNMTFTPNGFLFGVYPQFTVTVTVPDIILQANGNVDTRYWLAVSSELSTTGDFAYWVSYEHVYTPDMDSAPTWQYLASAGSWEEYDSSGPNEGYMKVSGECDTLGLGDISSFDFAYYPNPVSDVLNIKSQKAVQSVEVFNLAGQNVLAQKQLSANGQINVDALSPGVYVFKVTLEGGQVETFKIIKK